MFVSAPMEEVQHRLGLLSDQRAERAEVENELDKEHADELNKLRHDLAQQVRIKRPHDLYSIT